MSIIAPGSERWEELLSCIIESCTRSAYTINIELCEKHYQRWRNLGCPENKQLAGKRKTCKKEGCNKRHQARGFCKSHWQTEWKDKSSTCRHEGCDDPERGKGYCAGHLVQYNKYGETRDKNPARQRGDKYRRNVCKNSECNKKAHAYNYCQLHYLQAARNGDIAIKTWQELEGTWYKDKNGYIAGYEPTTKQFILQHRYIMELHLGRELLPNEDVHHKNGITYDNRISNLEVVPFFKHGRGQKIPDLIEYIANYWPDEMKAALQEVDSRPDDYDEAREIAASG